MITLMAILLSTYISLWCARAAQYLSALFHFAPHDVTTNFFVFRRVKKLLSARRARSASSYYYVHTYGGPDICHILHLVRHTRDTTTIVGVKLSLISYIYSCLEYSRSTHAFCDISVNLSRAWQHLLTAAGTTN